MFEARLEQGIILKKIVEAIKEIVSSVNIEVGPSGINIQAMDPSHIALVSLTLQETGFTDYRADRSFVIGLDVNNLFKILKIAGNDDIITMKTEQEEPTYLRFIFEDPSNYHFSFTFAYIFPIETEKVSEFNLNLITLDNEQLGISDSEHACLITMSSAEFTKTIREISSLSETVTIDVNKEFIKFSVTGDIGAGSIKIKARESDKREDQVILEVDEDVSLSFGLRYLTMFSKAASLSTQVILSLSNEAPLIVDYKIDKMGNLKFYLAPKISEEETS
eukprot:TRINITY_DN1125_c0_g3_i2.p1 TRINITY_DN1125_c0_g3~~TRINITY_DN1125_c0_g3_i2.p1  ORF type:complete len:277 (-),score=83.95 TRINITY_DN1125_c0_g3_i2:77-907(-)